MRLLHTCTRSRRQLSTVTSRCVYERMKILVLFVCCFVSMLCPYVPCGERSRTQRRGSFTDQSKFSTPFQLENLLVATDGECYVHIMCWNTLYYLSAEFCFFLSFFVYLYFFFCGCSLCCVAVVCFIIYLTKFNLIVFTKQYTHSQTHEGSIKLCDFGSATNVRLNPATMSSMEVQVKQIKVHHKSQRSLFFSSFCSPFPGCIMYYCM